MDHSSEVALTNSRLERDPMVEDKISLRDIIDIYRNAVSQAILESLSARETKRMRQKLKESDQ